MVKIHFLNVDQGDTIILQWQNTDSNGIGIIDCNINDKGENKCIEFLQNQIIQKIDFIILSHPHFDHYSGMNGLLEYCDRNKIIIKRFLHTSAQVPDFLRVATRSKLAEKELENLFTNIISLRNNNLIEKVSYLNNDCKDIELKEGLKIITLSPSTITSEKYLQNVKTLFNEEDSKNNPNANWLSTLLKIETANWYLLLTSDVEKSVLKTLGMKENHHFKKKLALCQSPHHGAGGNHYNIFWKLRNKNNGTPVIYSVGQNTYNHPSLLSIKSFQENGYDIHSTNKIGGLKLNTKNKEIDLISNLLNTVSELKPSELESNKFEGHQSFLINELGDVIKISTYGT